MAAHAALATCAVLSLASSAAGAAESSPSPADKLGEVELFRRCYAQITGEIPSRTLSLMQKVRAGTKTAVAACEGVLTGVQLNATTGLAEFQDSASTGLSSTEGQAVAQAVLRTFNNVHRTWFPSDSMFSGLADGSRYYQTRAIIEEGAPALYVTRALLRADTGYDTAVTLSEPLESIRSGGSSSLSGYAQSDSAGSTVTLQTGGNLGVQTGTLLGVRKISEGDAAKGAATKTLTRKTGATSPTSRSAVSLRQHLGGGILGDESYLLLNLGITLSEDGSSTYNPVDGGLVMPRRHARSSFMDLLCRDIPPLRSTDAAIFVQSTPTADTPAFRTSASCMSCHASLDGFAGAARQAHYGTISAGTTTLQTSMHLVVTTTTMPRETGTVDLDANFEKRPPNGKLFYRSYDGTLVNEPASNLSEMGAAMAETNDYYVCAANRYFQYFTGIKVNLQDQGDPEAESLDEAETKYRETVITLGTSFKSHRSLKRLIQEILELPLYQSRGQREAFATSSSGGTE